MKKNKQVINVTTDNTDQLKQEFFNKVCDMLDLKLDNNFFTANEQRELFEEKCGLVRSIYNGVNEVILIRNKEKSDKYYGTVKEIMAQLSNITSNMEDITNNKQLKDNIEFIITVCPKKQYGQFTDKHSLKINQVFKKGEEKRQELERQIKKEEERRSEQERQQKLLAEQKLERDRERREIIQMTEEDALANQIRQQEKKERIRKLLEEQQKLLEQQKLVKEREKLQEGREIIQMTQEDQLSRQVREQEIQQKLAEERERKREAEERIQMNKEDELSSQRREQEKEELKKQEEFKKQMADKIAEDKERVSKREQNTKDFKLFIEKVKDLPEILQENNKDQLIEILKILNPNIKIGNEITLDSVCIGLDQTLRKQTKDSKYNAMQSIVIGSHDDHNKLKTNYNKLTDLVNNVISPEKKPSTENKIENSDEVVEDLTKKFVDMDEKSWQEKEDDRDKKRKSNNEELEMDF